MFLKGSASGAHSITLRQLALGLFAVASLSGCLSGSESPGIPTGGSGTPVTPAEVGTPIKVKDSATAVGHAAKVEQVTIKAFDGTDIALTVYYPTLAKGEAAPLLLHSHGFGGSRTTSLDFDEATQTSEIGVDVLQMAYNQKNAVAGRKGWYVISYDQRGHGDSGGNVSILDPNIEGKDFSTVLDWAQANLPNLGYRTKGNAPDPVVGTIGRSYGGAFQLIGAGLDGRVDAMVPGGTWYDLRYSLNPGGVPKTAYLDGLVAAGAQSNKGRYDQFLIQGLVEANTTGVVNDTIVKRLGSQGAVSYCDLTQNLPNGMTLKSIPAFFVQGATDVLFNLREGLQNFECYRKVNADSKLLFVKYGHSLSALRIQKDPAGELAGTGAKYAFNESLVWLKTAQNQCPATLYDQATGRCVIPLKDMMFQFLVQNLIGKNEANSKTYLGFDPVPVPEIAAVLEDSRPDPTAVAIQAKGADRPKLEGLRAASAFTASTQVVTGLLGVPSGLSSTQGSQLAQPVYVDLNNANLPGCYVGVPKATVKVEPVGLPSPEAPEVFVGLGLERADGTKTVLHDQITPIKGYGEKTLELPGISVRLQAGDKLTLNLQGYNPVFLTSFNRVPVPVNVSASVALPNTVTDSTGFCGQ
ncbi:CocE/NonD family hydrolase [Limnobacter humi]|uniref:CocE/NonD family hydrolase n=1 Tax=Limnobacter humi TaxID=1778671 RepID=A0ABT1WHH0_9BURK|nr:CocE/NonD family hydrolase [Limnobacter humi]MCQ8896973.1 CocE/NonD family hydrolase [Limnobacter humi]